MEDGRWESLRQRSSNALLELNYIINRARPGDPGKAFLPPFAKLLLDRLLQPSNGQLGALIAALGRGVHEKHVVLYFTDPSLERVVIGAHADGVEHASAAHDALLVTDANVSGGKDDLFVDRHYTLTAAVTRQGAVRDKLVLTYRYPVQTVAANLNLIVNLDGNYYDYVQVVVPANATLNAITLTAGGSTTSVSAESVLKDRARTTFAYLLPVLQGQTVALEFDYGGAFEASGTGYQLAWEKQLNAISWPISVDVQLPGRAVRHWASDLSADREFSAS